MIPQEIQNVVCQGIVNPIDCAKQFIAQSNKIYLLIYGLILLFVIVQIFITTLLTSKKSFGYWIGIVLLDIIFLIAMFIIIFVALPDIMVMLNIV